MRLAGTALGGLILADVCARPLPLLAVLLLALAVSGRHTLTAALAIGLLAGWWRPSAAPPAQGPPVTLVGVLERPWRPTEDGWLGSLRVERYRQGLDVELWRERVTLLLPGEPAPPAGRRLRVRGLLRRAPGLANVPALSAGPWRLRLKSRRFVEARSAGADLGWRLAQAARGRIEDAMMRAGEGSGVRLARALVLADASRLPPRWRRGLRAAGLAHLVALSGLHVGLLVGCFLLAGAWLPRGLGPLLGVLAALGFLLLAGARPALLRATIMGLLAAVALSLDRRAHGLSLLTLIAACLALLEPRLLEDLGYRLTCAATAGILWLSPRFSEAWTGLPGWLRRPLAITAGAQLASLPWSLPAFRLLSPLAPCWNLVAVPWTAVGLAACLAWSAVALVWPAVAVGLAPGLDAAAWPFAVVGGLPPTITRPLPLVLPMGGAALLAAGLVFVLSKPARRWPWVPLALLVMGLTGPVDRGLELRMLDVGQGEAVLLRDGGAAVLVDGGGWRHGDLGGRVLLPVLAAAGVRRLDGMVLSHPDLDHCGGLLDLASYLPVNEIWTPPGWRSSACARDLLATAGAGLRPLWAGERAVVGRWRLLALHPAPGSVGRGNDRSLVLAASAPGLRVLLTGDIGAGTERRLRERWPGATLGSDVLKVAHHGSDSSTSGALLAAVRPRLALISCGRGNQYGHPAAPVLGRLERSGARVLRTDRSGEIVLRATPGGWRTVTPALPRPD